MIIQIAEQQRPVVEMGHDAEQVLYVGQGRYFLADRSGMQGEVAGAMVNYREDAITELRQPEALSWCRARGFAFDYSMANVMQNQAS